MEKIKSLADQLREQMGNSGEKPKEVKPKRSVGKNIGLDKTIQKRTDSDILRSLNAYDNTDHKSLVHFRFNKPTVNFLNQFKIATGIDATKFVAFSVRHMIESYPELKTIIKQFIQNSEL